MLLNTQYCQRYTSANPQPPSSAGVWLCCRSLLILDDVWDSYTLRAFDLQCRVVLTTRNSSLTDSVSGGELFYDLMQLVFVYACYCRLRMKL